MSAFPKSTIAGWNRRSDADSRAALATPIRLTMTIRPRRYSAKPRQVDLLPESQRVGEARYIQEAGHLLTGCRIPAAPLKGS